jgi:hypothetical protein
MLTKPRGPTDKVVAKKRIPSHSERIQCELVGDLHFSQSSNDRYANRAEAKPVRFSFRSIPRLAQL